MRELEASEAVDLSLVLSDRNESTFKGREPHVSSGSRTGLHGSGTVRGAPALPFGGSWEELEATAGR